MAAFHVTVEWPARTGIRRRPCRPWLVWIDADDADDARRLIEQDVTPDGGKVTLVEPQDS